MTPKELSLKISNCDHGSETSWRIMIETNQKIETSHLNHVGKTNQNLNNTKP